MTNTEYAYVGDVTLKEFAEIKKAFPVLMGIDVTEVEGGKQLIALGVPSDLGDKVGGMYQSIVTLFFDDNLRKKVTDVVWGDDTETESEDESDVLIDALLEQTDLARQYKKDAVKWAKKYDDLAYQYHKLYCAHSAGKLVWKED